MQLASDTYKGGLITVFYGPDSKLNYACKKAKEWAVDKGDPMPECRISNYLYPHCKVVAGSESVRNFTFFIILLFICFNLKANQVI